MACDHPTAARGCFIEHPFAYVTDPVDREEWDNGFGTFHTRPDVGPEAAAEDFAAQYRRVSGMLRTRLGAPLPEGAYQSLGTGSRCGSGATPGWCCSSPRTTSRTARTTGRAGIPVGRTIVDTLAQFRAGARSLAHPEYLVPALSGTGIADG